MPDRVEIKSTCQYCGNETTGWIWEYHLDDTPICGKCGMVDTSERKPTGRRYDPRNEKWDTYQQAREKWGEEDQLWMLVGEFGELLDQLGKRVQGRLDQEDLIDEIADAQIMLEQLQEMVGREKVEAAKRHKIQRLKNKLEEN